MSATRDTAFPPTAVMRDGASDSEAPAPRFGVLRPPGRPPGQGHPAAGAPQAGELGESAPGVTSGSSHLRANRRREGEPRCSEFRLFVRPLSPVFVLTWPLVSRSLHFCISGADSLWTLSLPLSPLPQCVLTLLLSPRAALWFRARMSHRLLGHLSGFFLSLSLCQRCVLVSLPPNWVCLGRAGLAWTSETWKVTHDPVKLFCPGNITSSLTTVWPQF